GIRWRLLVHNHTGRRHKNQWSHFSQKQLNKMNYKKLYFSILILFSGFVFGQEVSLFQQFLGKYDFTMIGNTLNIAPNGTNVPCVILTSSSATLNMAPDQDIQAAYLYWGGSGSNAQFDFDIKLNGV